MRLRLLALAWILASVPLATNALAQRHKLGTVNTETPEGALLQKIGQESDDAKKIPLLEEFAAKYPKHESIGWVYTQLQVADGKTGQNDKTIEIGEKLLAMDADDIDAAYENLKAAEAKKDPAVVKKWSAVASQLCQKVMALPKPQDAAAVDDWKRQVDFATQLNDRTEYSLYAAALQTTDPRGRVDLIEALEQRNPKSRWLPQTYPLMFVSYRQLNDNDKAAALAEKLVAEGKGDEDMLTFLANRYMEQKKEPDKIVDYSNKIIELLNTKPKPDGVSDDDWNKKKKMLTGLAYFMSGSTLFDQKKLPAADKALRAAVPLVEGNDQLKAATLFYAGLTAYNLKNYTDALKFNQQCAAIKSPFQAKAAANVKAIRGQTTAAR